MRPQKEYRYVAAGIAGFVAIWETVYFVAHPHRPGPALMIAALALAVGLLALSWGSESP